jgi:hypothetical protein
LERNYKRWSKLPYAGEKFPPQNAEQPLAGSWPLFFLKRNKKGKFFTPDGKKIHFKIKSPRYIDWNEQLTFVQDTLGNLTDHKIEVAKYWGTGVATKQWTPIVDRLIDTYGIAELPLAPKSAPRAARVLATLQAALNDCFVITWFLKYKLDVARPNQLDQNMSTVVCTPRHPTYPSGHSVVAGCAETILTYFFPAESERLHELAEECAISRYYGGVHFPVDNDEGLNLGRQIGKIIVETLAEQENAKGKPVDVPFVEPRQAVLPPQNYEQVIPFDFLNICQSKLIKLDDKRSKKKYSFSKWKKKYFH